MLFLSHLQVANFKNHAEKEITFSSKLNALCGKNGSGKTNILDAINYLCLTKSYFNPIDGQNIKEKENYFTIKGVFHHGDNNYEVFCGYTDGSKKILKLNQVPYEKLNEHIGLLPLITNAPADAAIITGGSLERRKFIDSTLSQTDADYLLTLIRYNKLLEQRNAQLKLFEKNNSFNPDLLAMFDDQMAPLNNLIHKKRKDFFVLLNSYFVEFAATIAEAKEPVAIDYNSEFNQVDYMFAATRNIKRDLALGYSSSGVHRDDLEITFNNQPARKWASQGQQKTILLALRLAQLSYIEKQKGVKPILLLDDIFDKLDTYRCKALIKLLNSDLVGQVIISHTSGDVFENETIININS